MSRYFISPKNFVFLNKSSNSHFLRWNFASRCVVFYFFICGIMLKRLLTIAIIAIQCAFAAIALESEGRMAMQPISASEATIDAECINVNGQIVTITNVTSAYCVYNVYCVTGQSVKVIRLGAGAHVSFELPKGFYVVKCNNEWSRKIIVR